MNAYAHALATVEAYAKSHPETEPAVLGYMAARAALLFIGAVAGNDKAAEVAYKLADEFATLGMERG